MKPTLALFDFDGTLTKKDTFLEFIRFYHGALKFMTGFLLLSPLLVLFKLRVIPNWRAKEIVLSYFFKGIPVSEFQKKCDEFAEYIPSMLRPRAIEQLKQHLNNGDKVMIVSASAENWIKKWSESLGVELIATRMEIKGGKITGKIAGRNCYGAEKVIRIVEVIRREHFNNIYAYGDSRGDKELLAFSTHPFYRHF